jgi:hypothetical protein
MSALDRRPRGAADRRPCVWLGAILAAGLVLRVWGLDFGLPNAHCRPDESTLVNKAAAIAAGELNPHFFNYPSFHFYLLALLYGLYFAGGWAAGAFSDAADFQRLFFLDPSPFYLIGRGCSVVLGTGSIGLTYLIGRRLDGRRAGLLAALFLGLAFLHVRDSHFLTVDVPATFYMLLGWVFILRFAAASGSGRRELLLGAACFGLAASTKYNLGLFGAAALAAPWLPGRRRGPLPWKETLGALGVMLAVFLAGSPYALLDSGAFWRDLSYERLHFAVGHGGQDLGRGWSRHLAFTLPRGLGWPLMLTGLAGCLRLARRRRPADLALLGGLLLYYGVAGSGKGVFMRYMLPLVPLLCAAAGGVLDAVDRGRGRWWVFALALLLVAPTARAAWQHDGLLAREDTRLTAARWIEDQLPDGTRIAMCGSDFGYPQVHPTRDWLQRELEDARAAGASGRRLESMLRQEGYPPPPRYDVVELKPDNPLNRRAVRTGCDLDCLRAEGIEWVVTQEHPLAYSRLDPGFRLRLEREAVEVRCFDPFRRGTARPEYDPADAYYVPLSGFGGVERPGPLLRIYRLPVSGGPGP